MNNEKQIQILGVAEAALYVADLERAKAFYTEVLGLTLTMQFADSCFVQTGPTSTLILFEISQIEVRENAIPAHGTTGAAHVALAIAPSEQEAWRQRLLAHGVAIEHEQDWPMGTHSIYFRDPDGHSLELIDGSHYEMIWQRVQAGKKAY